MARIRTIKPDFFVDEKLNECSHSARLLFIGLLVFSDDMGRQQYNSSRTRAQIFPRDNISDETVEQFIAELVKLELIRLYRVGKQRCIWIPGFLRHQTINKPGHSSLPPHPDDLKSCRCGLCKQKQLAGISPKFPRTYEESIQPNVPAGTPGIPEFRNTGVQSYGITSAEVGSRSKYKTNTNTYAMDASEHPLETIDSATTETTGVNRRAQRRVLEEFAMQVISLLQIPPNSLTIETLAKSIEIRARSLECSFEEAFRQIAAPASVLLAAHTIPEDWTKWFFDMRFIYVPEGDSRLSDRHLEARPTCGGSRCSEGWETVQVNGSAILRRCTDCEKLWEETEW